MTTAIDGFTRLRYDVSMTEGELQARLPAILATARDTSPLVVSVDATAFTDSTGADAIRFEVALSDPPGGVIRYLEVEPVEVAIHRLTADLGLLVYVGFHLASEQREIEAGTYYG